MGKSFDTGITQDYVSKDVSLSPIAQRVLLFKWQEYKLFVNGEELERGSPGSQSLDPGTRKYLDLMSWTRVSRHERARLTEL